MTGAESYSMPTAAPSPESRSTSDGGLSSGQSGNAPCDSLKARFNNEACVAADGSCRSARRAPQNADATATLAAIDRIGRRSPTVLTGRPSGETYQITSLIIICGNRLRHDHQPLAQGLLPGGSSRSPSADGLETPRQRSRAKRWRCRPEGPRRPCGGEPVARGLGGRRDSGATIGFRHTP